VVVALYYHLHNGVSKETAGAASQKCATYHLRRIAGSSSKGTSEAGAPKFNT